MNIPILRFSRSAAVRSFLLLSTLAVSTASTAADESEYPQLMWVDLLPFEDLQALYNPPPILHFGDEGESQALRRNSQGEFSDPGEDAFEKALVSTNVKPELNNTAIRLPGFVVPLEYDAEQRVTEFFLVPYFGACLHVPPPPPNQLVFVSYPQGLELDSIWDPYNVAGTLLTEITDNAMALSAYRMEATEITLYVAEEIEE